MVKQVSDTKTITNTDCTILKKKPLQFIRPTNEFYSSQTHEGLGFLRKLELPIEFGEECTTRTVLGKKIFIMLRAFQVQ